MAAIPFILLIGALLLFLLSTKQWQLWLRGIVWAGALLLLVVAALMVVSDKGHSGGLLRAFGDLAAHWYAPGESVLAQSLGRNGPYIGRFVSPLLDLFLILGLIVGIVALVAFTPGEALEKALRPVMIGLVGAILGGVLALAIVGTGFGEVAQQKVYSTYMTSNDVVSGDTIWVGEVSLRLRGIEAPQIGQTCRAGAVKKDCGEEAKKHLESVVAGALITCVAEESERRSEGGFGRPVVSCSVSKGSEPAFDLGRKLVEDGFAIELRGVAGDYVRESQLAQLNKAGLTPFCYVRPDAWRSLGDRDRAAFADRGVVPRGTPTVGPCPVQRTGGSQSPSGPTDAP